MKITIKRVIYERYILRVEIFKQLHDLHDDLYYGLDEISECDLQNYYDKTKHLFESYSASLYDDKSEIVMTKKEYTNLLKVYMYRCQLVKLIQESTHTTFEELSNYYTTMSIILNNFNRLIKSNED